MFVISGRTTVLTLGTLLLVLAGCGPPCDTECNGDCVDLGSDPANCGGCGITCRPGVQCVYGACVFGAVDISFSTSFIYSGALLDGGGSYRWDHFDSAVQSSGALTGIFDDSAPIPPSGAYETFSYAIHYENSPGDWRLNVQQSSFTDSTHDTEMYPEGRIAFPTDNLTVGELPISLPGSNQANAVFIYLVTEGSTDTCVHAFAYGKLLTITQATNTTADDGGQLAFWAADVPLYHPTQTPLGDITQELAAATDLTVCP